MYTMYTDVFLIELVRLSLNQNTDDSVVVVLYVYITGGTWLWGKTGCGATVAKE